jgi:hypothetical protein
MALVRKDLPYILLEPFAGVLDPYIHTGWRTSALMLHLSGTTITFVITMGLSGPVSPARARRVWPEIQASLAGRPLIQSPLVNNRVWRICGQPFEKHRGYRLARLATRLVSGLQRLSDRLSATRLTRGRGTASLPGTRETGRLRSKEAVTRAEGTALAQSLLAEGVVLLQKK